MPLHRVSTASDVPMKEALEKDAFDRPEYTKNTKRKLGRPKKNLHHEVAGVESPDQEVPVYGAVREAIQVSTQEAKMPTTYTPKNPVLEVGTALTTNIADRIVLAQEHKRDLKQWKESQQAVGPVLPHGEATKHPDVPDANIAVDKPEDAHRRFCYCDYCGEYAGDVQRKFIMWHRLPDSVRRIYNSLAAAESKGEIESLNVETIDKRRKINKVLSL